MIILALALLASTSCTATDGDTLRCKGEKVRVLGIDTPELPGHCRPGRACVPGDGVASKRAAADFLAGKRVYISRVGHDRYGRTLAVVTAGGRNFSCNQLAVGGAVYRRDWDNGGRIMRACPALARAHRIK